MKAAVIIGGGPAGCQCALWLCMLGYEATIIEKSDRLGGLQCNSPYVNDWLVGTVNLRGQDIANNIQKQIEKMNIPVLYNSIINSIKKNSTGFEINTGNEIIATHNLVIATGVRPRDGSFESTSAVIVGPGKEIYNEQFTNRRVAILGGGDSAAENYSFIREKNPKLCHVYARTVKARQNLWGKIDSSDIFLGEYKADQKSMSIIHDDKMYIYDIFTVLYGWEANIPNSLLSLKNQLLNEQGFIAIDESRRTRISNIFAAGEVTHFLHPCVATAMADGVIVAKSIQFQFENIIA
ncbi:MAG TPA: NAD(P)/FAD-dependent oxidoreductase [Candidatus Saccharimonadales bacterium]|nr:NAD(P)/FAD-dependent oxidoreductase [Candidatus Saccharimonadales bacterium]